jgi:hypothetical protein
VAARRRSGFRPAFKGQVCSLGYTLIDDIEADLDVELTDDQAVRLVRLYELDPVTGRRLVRRAALRRPKGAGKSPEAGYVAFAELTGPVLFDHFDDDGQPVGRPWGIDLDDQPAGPEPWVQLAAVSEDQTDNVMVWLYEKLVDLPDTCSRHGLDVGRTRIYLTGRSGRLEIVSSAGDSREGQRVTFGVLDQTESWNRQNKGIKLAATLRRNAAKMGGWTYELQNAPEPDDGSVADLTAKAAKASGVLFDAIVPPFVQDLKDRGSLLASLAVAYGDAAVHVDPRTGRTMGWVDLERLADEAADPDTDPADVYRYYLNTPEVQSERAFDRKLWKLLEVVDAPPEGRFVVAGFDGSKFDDATALVACDIETGVVWLHALWERPDNAPDDWEVPIDEVGAQVDDLFARWNVWRLYADPAHWRESIAAWAGKHDRAKERRVIEWWTNRPKQVGYACRNLASAVRSGTIHHHANDDLDRHIRNAVKYKMHAYDEDRRALWSIAKPTPSLKIDAAMATVLAWEARNDAMAFGATPAPPKPRVVLPGRIR